MLVLNYFYLNPVINLCVGSVFNSWESVDTIMEAYGKKHGFTTIKKWLIRYNNSSIKHCSFGCSLVTIINQESKLILINIVIVDRNDDNVHGM